MARPIKRKDVFMGRELQGYRENLEILNNRFPNYDMLSRQEVMDVTNIRSRTTVCKHFKFNNAGKLSKRDLAVWMCGKQ
jgi:hypothetical protein